ncbi:UDP-2,4-diacetamido-2,4,6-trideoxy-beta-L-altropyranose hydrolase [Colwellia sp. 39_35_sub15_T18]|nr:UDP-2,4-diacetamido-2,4,6-trideoxy-beta-L-altropyranose hydrolase [Colwellia sp. 39_35_sub15_T18]
MTSCLLFRFDASSEIGLGHAFRCSALIEFFSMNYRMLTLKCVVVSRALPSFLHDRLLAMGAEIHTLSNTLELIDEIDLLTCLNQRYQANVLLIDGYQFDQYYRQCLGQSALNIISFDDINSLTNLHCDMVINALENAHELGYQHSAPQAKHLLGLQYSIIRQEFLLADKKPFKERTKLLVNFGGSDIGGLTLLILQLLAQGQFAIKANQIVVITGAGCHKAGEIAKFCQQEGFQYQHNCNNMAAILQQTRLAICAPGAIVYELAYCHVPSVFLTIADNQLLSAKAHQKAGWCYTFNGLTDDGVIQAIAQAKTLWLSQSQLNLLSAKAGQLIDGQGVARIAENIINHLYKHD